MKEMVLDLPTFGFIVATRAALGAGVGLLCTQKLPAETRRAIGAALVAVGAITTVPAALAVMRSRRRGLLPSFDRDEHLIGATRFPRKGDDEI